MTYPQVLVSKIARVHYGKALKSSERIEEGDFPVFGSSGQVGFHDAAIVKHPTLIVGRKGSVGSVTYAEAGGWPIDTVFYTEFINPEDVSLRYFYYALKEANLARWTITTSIPGLNRNDIYSTRIPLPPLSEQHRIAAILDKADAIRRKRKEAIALTEELLRSAFLDMFGDPVTNPKGWKISALSNVTDRIIDCPHSTPKWTESGVICLRTSNLTYGGWNWEDTRFVTEQDYKDRTQRSEILPRDIILSREGTVGIAGIVPQGKRICMGQRLVQVRPDESEILSEYLIRVLLWKLAPERLNQLMRGSTSRHLNVKDLRSMPIPIASLKIQKQFSNFATKLATLQSRLDYDADLNNSNFNSLLQRAFRGKL